MSKETQNPVVTHGTIRCTSTSRVTMSLPSLLFGREFNSTDVTIVKLEDGTIQIKPKENPILRAQVFALKDGVISVDREYVLTSVNLKAFGELQYLRYTCVNPPKHAIFKVLAIHRDWHVICIRAGVDTWYYHFVSPSHMKNEVDMIRAVATIDEPTPAPKKKVAAKKPVVKKEAPAKPVAKKKAESKKAPVKKATTKSTKTNPYKSSADNYDRKD